MVCATSCCPQDEARRLVPRSVTGSDVTTAQPPHSVASRRASLRSLPASAPATNSLATRGERGGCFRSSGVCGERQTRPERSSAGDCSRAAFARAPAAMRNRRPEVGAKSGSDRSRSCRRAGSQGSSESPCPGRSRATDSMSSWREISAGRAAQASISAPGSWSRSATSGWLPQRSPRRTAPQGSCRSTA